MASQKFAIRLSVEDTEKVRNALKGLGADGAAALKVFGDAADKAAAKAAGLKAEAKGADAAVDGLDRSARKAKTGLDTFGDTVGRVRSSLSALGLASGLSGAAIVASAGAMADAWTTAGNQITAAGVAYADLEDTQQALIDIAVETRSGLSPTIELFTRLTRSTEDLGASQREVLRVTETLNKAFATGGATTAERASLVTQIGQGLSSATLQGDELRSIRENSRIVAEAIAAEFGVTVGALKELGATGELESRRVFEAILKVSEEVDAQFSGTVLTIKDGFNVLGTEATAAIGRFDEMYGITLTWATAMERVANAIASMGPGPGGGGPQNMMALRAKGIRIEGDVNRVATEISPYFDDIPAIRQLSEDEQKLAAQRRAQATERLAGLEAELRLLQKQNEAVLNSMVEPSGELSRMLGLKNPQADAIRNGMSAIIDTMEAVQAKAAALDALPDQAFVAGEAVKRETAEERQARLDAEREYERLQVRAVQLRAEMGDHTGRLLVMEKELNTLVKAGLISRELADDRMQRELDALSGIVPLYKRMEETLARINAMDVTLSYDFDQTALEDYLKQADALAMQLGLIDTPRIAEMRESVRDAVRDGFREGVATDDWGTAFRNILASIVTDIFDSALRKFADTITDSIVDSQRAGKSSGNYWGTILSALGGFVTEYGLGGSGGGGVPVGDEYAFAKGGAFTNGVFHRETPFRFSSGGAFERLGVMGEAGPEAVMPLERTSDGRLGVIASGGGGGATEIHIHNYAGGEVETRRSATASGGERVDVIIRRMAKAGAAEFLASGEGAKLMRDQYGLSRPATRR